MLALCATLVAGWVPSTSSIFGAQRNEIVDQLAGVPLPADRNWQTQLGSLWTLPADSLDTTGLGGGITFAFDPQLCGRIMPLFREDIAGASFITCDDIKASVFRAFNAWGTNSRFFKFTDVTAECETLGLLHGGQEEQPHGGCALAEIWITALTREESRRRQLQEVRRRLDTEGGAGSPKGGGLHIESAEQNLDSGGLFVASALSHWRASYSFRYTNGEAAFQWVLTGGEWERQPRPVLETYAGTLAYGVDGGSGGVGLCWYLDSTFCSQFHELKRRMGGPSQARSLMYALFLLTSLGTLLLGCFLRAQFWQALCGCGISTLRFKKARAAAPEKEPEEIVEELLQGSTLRTRLGNAFEEAAEWNPLLTSLQVMLVLSPPILLAKIILPCWDCYDFEAATLHEIGHFLGLGHPDNIPDNLRSDLAWVGAQDTPESLYQADLAQGRRTNASSCHSMWERVYGGVPPDATLAADGQVGASRGYPVRNLIMKAFTQHNPQPCLTADDVEGIATLYPDCSEHGISRVVCHKVRHNIGVVRIAVYVLVPMVLTLLVMMCCAGYMNEHNNEEAEEAHVELTLAREENKKLRRAGTHPRGSAPAGAAHCTRGTSSHNGGNMVAPSELPPLMPARGQEHRDVEA